MDPILIFEQVANTGLYEIKASDQVGWSAYVLPDNKDLPVNIKIEESLSKYEGNYVFAVGRPPCVSDNPGDFAAKVNDYVKSNTRINRALLWLRNVFPLEFGNFSSFGLQFNYDGIYKEYVIQSNMNVSLGINLNYYLLQGLTLSVNNQEQCLSLAVKKGPISFIGFQNNNIDIGIQVGDDADIQYAYIPLGGANSACFLFPAIINPARTFSNKDGLELGFQYIINDKVEKNDRILFYDGFHINAMPRTLGCIASIDPSDPFNTGLADEARVSGYLRTGFAVLGSPVLESAFRTVEGSVISLLPIGATKGDVFLKPMAGAFALASSARTHSDQYISRAYFTLAGSYGIVANGYEPFSKAQILCGLFGSERLYFTTYNTEMSNNDLLLFSVSMPAYATAFPFEKADLNQPSSGSVRALLTDDYRTSWATIIQGKTSVYYGAEPESNYLYGIDKNTAGTGSTGGVALLPSAPPYIPLPQGTLYAFPLVPYGILSNMDMDGNILTEFESQIITNTRKSIISLGAEATWKSREKVLEGTSVETDLRTTPQGFLAEVETSTGAYANVTMAQSMDSAGNIKAFSFNKPVRGLQDALQTNQLFLVAVNDQNLVNGVLGASFQNEVYMAGWNMIAKVGEGVTPTSYRNVMIFKFCEGTLEERVTNPNRWTNPSSFSLAKGSEHAPDLAYLGLSQWLQDYIAQCKNRVMGANGNLYENFVKIATDLHWRGVIVLEADLTIENLPVEIQGLAAGIDFTNFTVHHFGFTVSRVKLLGGSGRLAMDGISSMFGLVDYINPSYARNLDAGGNPLSPIPVKTSNDLEFTVLQLQSLFENSKLAKFNSRVQLTVDKLFGLPVSQSYNQGIAVPANGLVLNGSSVDQNGEPSYVFENTQTNVFVLGGNVLSAVAFSRVQFNTMGLIKDKTVMANRFVVWGNLDFDQLEDIEGLFDVFSFGSEKGTQGSMLGKGLAYSNLIIDMTFPVLVPNAKTFALDTSNMAFDLNASEPRKESLFHGFGLQLKSFITSHDNKTPGDYGYIPVTSGLYTVPLESPWYGIEYEITLGGPGALGSDLGFHSRLLTAWSPSIKQQDQNNLSVFMGISLPGAAPGSNVFSIEGIFKVSVGSISILRQPVLNNQRSLEDKTFFYCLRMDDIGMKIFGLIKLPPDANIQFFLFGDPDNSGALGWYAAYVADGSKSINTAKLNL